MSTRRRVRFIGPEEVDVTREPVPAPSPEQVRIRTLYSAISPGTERLVYEGQVPSSMEADPSIDAFAEDDLSYPLSYGYACVGKVDQVGERVEGEWRGKRVFAFHPHVSRFTASPEALIPLPEHVDSTDAVLIPSVETAVNLVMDGRPVIGEHVLLFGQGVIGLLTAGLLANFPLSSLVTVDPSESRRARSKKFGADLTLSSLPLTDGSREQQPASPGPPSFRVGQDHADLVYELTGQPSVLNDAIEQTSYDGRIVVGSWYGTKSAPIKLGGRFHRSRIEIISSQVSTIAPSYRGRWTKDRRMSVVLDQLNKLEPSQLVTDRFDLDDAPAVYERLTSDRSMLQPIFVYD